MNNQDEAINLLSEYLTTVSNDIKVNNIMISTLTSSIQQLSSNIETLIINSTYMTQEQRQQAVREVDSFRGFHNKLAKSNLSKIGEIRDKSKLDMELFVRSILRLLDED